jgi:hypothetical protein
MRALTGIEVKHNRRYGADCGHILGPAEAVAEIAAPHPNEGPHLAAGLRARATADRSGARGKNNEPDSQWLMRSNELKDPETVQLRRGSDPIPRIARLSAGRVVLSRLPVRRAPKRRGLDRTPLPAKTHLIRGNGISWLRRFHPKLRGPPVGRGLQTYFGLFS